MTSFRIDDESANKRLDHYIVDKAPALSRASIQKIIKNGKVTVNGKSNKSSYKLQSGDHIDINYDEQSQEDIDVQQLPVIYEDDDCVVIDKPAGVLTHSKGAFNPESTVATFVASLSDQVTGERSGIVHRLDRATSGVMIAAKTPEALSWLQKQFSTRKVKKTYVAVVDKVLSPEHAIIDMPIERNPQRPQTFRVGPNGKPAITEYIVTSASPQASLLELKPTTGRTHQLRVHMAHQKAPIRGDTLYEGKPAHRLFLHAHKLEITLPNRARKVFVSPVPKEFNQALSQ